MKWRTLLGVCAGVLLPLPLMLLGGALLRPEQPADIVQESRISPKLDREHRMRLMTYRRPCGSSADCEPPLGCLFEVRSGHSYCSDSQCTADAQCPQGHVCQNIATADDGPLVRFCIPIGVRREGERCIEIPSDKESACARGLMCGGRDAWCARPCSLGDPANCPEGFFCARTVPQALCLPTCEERGCPTGQHCIRFKEGASICTRVYGPDCQRSPCPEGRECRVRMSPPDPGEVWMECVERCGEDFPPCGAGAICDGWQCRPACDPQGPEACGEGYRCRQRRPDRPFACQPDW